MATLQVTDLEDLREDLLKGLSALGDKLRSEKTPPASRPEIRGVISRLDFLVTQIDEMRPLGPDGKHGDRHTPWCGCEDMNVRPSKPMRYDPEIRAWVDVAEDNQNEPAETRAEVRIRTLRSQGCVCGISDAGEVVSKNPYCPIHKYKQNH